MRAQNETNQHKEVRNVLKWWKKFIQKVKKEALSIIIITLLLVYVFISYRTYIIQQNRLEIEHLAYQLTLHFEELEHQNDCMDKILEILEADPRNPEFR